MSAAGPEAISQQALDLVRVAIAGAADFGTVIEPRAEAQVQRAIHLLRGSQANADILHRVEQISCTLMEMSYLLRQGRVNAYESRRLRLKRVAQQL